MPCGKESARAGAPPPRHLRHTIFLGPPSPASALTQLITEAADLTFCGLYLRSQGRLFSAAATQMGRQRCRCCAASSDLMSTPSTVISSVLNRWPVALNPCQGDWRYDLLIAGGLQRAAIGESLIRLQLHSPIPPTLHSAGRRWLW